MKKKKVLLGFLVFVLGLTLVFSGCAPEGIDGKYDYDYGFVSVVGSDPASLTAGVRTIEMQCFDEDENLLGSRYVSAYIYSEEYVVAPVWLFYIPSSRGMISVFEYPAIASIKTFLLPDPTKEDDWKKEELGEFTICDDLSIVIIERNEPVIGLPQAEYTMGKYEDLAVGNVLYAVGQANGRGFVGQSSVGELYLDDGGRNLVGTPEEILFVDLGSLYFAIRDGEFELIGLICVTEPIRGASGMAYAHVLDINQIIDYIETMVKTK